MLIQPGNEIEIKRKDNKDIVIGPGLKKSTQNSLIAIKCGQLKKRENCFYWIDSKQKRYIPYRNDYIIGVVVNKSAETIKVEIGGSEYATLSFLAFENATKRNKPNIEIGDLVYSRILNGGKDMEPELVCIDSSGKANGLGILKDGFMFKVNLHLARRLLTTNDKLLELLGKNLPPFEITIGLNGRIWIKADSVKQTIFIVDAIKDYENINIDNVEEFINNLLNNYKDS